MCAGVRAYALVFTSIFVPASYNLVRCNKDVTSKQNSQGVFKIQTVRTATSNCLSVRVFSVRCKVSSAILSVLGLKNSVGYLHVFTHCNVHTVLAL
jgi:hypothetical protein